MDGRKWKQIQKKFIDSIHDNFVIVKYNFSELLQQEIARIRTNFNNAVEKLTNQVFDIFSQINGFGLRFKGELNIFHLKIAGLDIEMIYSTGSAQSCSRLGSLNNLIKGENTLNVLVYAGLSTGLIKLAPFLNLDTRGGIEVAFSTKIPGKVAALLHGEANVLGIRAGVDLIFSEHRHYFVMEGLLWNTFKAELKVSFEYGRNWNDIGTLDKQGKLLADSGDDNSFQDSYLDAFRKLGRKIAEEADKRISGVQKAFTSAQTALTNAQNWLEEKKSVIRSANTAFDAAVRAMEVAKDKLEEAKRPFKNAINALNEAQRKVDNLCKIQNCRQICVPGIKCKICWTKRLFIKVPYPCCQLTNCMFSFPDPICVAINLGCSVLRGIAFVALEVAKLAVHVPMLVLDAAKAAVSLAQFVVDKSRVVLDLAVAGIDLAKFGLEGAKLVLEGAKIALEAVKRVVAWGLKVFDFIVKYGVQSLIDIRNCGFESRVALTGTTVFQVECEINVFRLGFRKITLGINFGNPVQSIWQAAKGTADALAEATGTSDRKRRELRTQTVAVLHKLIRETRNADMNDENFDSFVNETIDAILYTSGFRENDTFNDYDIRVNAFKEKCNLFSNVFSFFSEAIQVLLELTNETANTFTNTASMQESLAGYNYEDLKGNLSMSHMGINAEAALNDFNISTDEITNALENVKQNLSNDPLLSGIHSLTTEASSMLQNQTDDMTKVRITDQWTVIMANVTEEYFDDEKCVTFVDCSHFGISIFYRLFDAENVTDMEESLDAISAFEDLFLETIGNNSKSIPEVNRMAKMLLGKLLEIRTHNYFCSSAPTVKSTSNITKVTTGSTLRLNCNATGNPKPKIWWYSEEHYIPDQNGPTLTIHNVSRSHALKYHCIVGNLVANISSGQMNVVVLDDDSTIAESNGFMPTLQPNPTTLLSSTFTDSEMQASQHTDDSETNLAVILAASLSVCGVAALIGSLVLWRAHARKRSFASLNIVKPDTQRPAHFQTRVSAFMETSKTASEY